MPFTMRLPILLGIFASLLSPAFAAETAWQDVAPGVRLRLISTGVVKPDGTTLLGLEIDMPETTKTYWRVPGDTGLPTVLDFTASTGVSLPAKPGMPCSASAPPITISWKPGPAMKPVLRRSG